MFILWLSWQSGAWPIYESSCWRHEEVDWGIWMMFALIFACNVAFQKAAPAEQRMRCPSLAILFQLKSLISGTKQTLLILKKKRNRRFWCYIMRKIHCFISKLFADRGSESQFAYCKFKMQSKLKPDSWATWLLHNPQHCLQVLGTEWHRGLYESQRQCNTATMLTACTTVSQHVFTPHLQKLGESR